MLERWAQENDLQLLETQYKWFRYGPFFWHNRMQTIYRFAVQDATGQVHSGWARVGNWWFGVFTYRVEVRWDDSLKPL
jgi:hypothetical protein